MKKYLEYFKVRTKKDSERQRGQSHEEDTPSMLRCVCCVLSVSERQELDSRCEVRGRLTGDPWHLQTPQNHKGLWVDGDGCCYWCWRELKQNKTNCLSWQVWAPQKKRQTGWLHAELKEGNGVVDVLTQRGRRRLKRSCCWIHPLTQSQVFLVWLLLFCRPTSLRIDFLPLKTSVRFCSF